MKKISQFAWEQEYTPIKNHIDGNAASEGLMFETYGPEHEFVREIAQKNPSKVWTFLDGNPEPYITNGFIEAGSFEDRFTIIGYFVTKKCAENTVKYKIL